MKYLCLVYNRQATVDALSDDEYGAVVDATLAYRETLRESGHYIDSSPLAPVRTARTVRPQKNKPALVTDGPFAETKEQLGGYYLIEVKDMDEAVSLASDMPPAQLGCIEVRALRELTERPGSHG